MIATIPEKNQKKNQFAQQSSPLREKKYFGLCLIIDENNYKRSRYLDCLMWTLSDDNVDLLGTTGKKILYSSKGWILYCWDLNLRPVYIIPE